MPSRKMEVMFPPWKARPRELFGSLMLTDRSSEWTFAKQKWQRTKNVVRGDPKYENAQILPGHNEKYYA